MGQLIQIDKYKGDKRKAYLKRYDTQIKKFIATFLDRHLSFSFEDLSYYFIANQQQTASWDYVDFRDTLRDGFHEAFAKELKTACQSQYWYDERFITEDELVEQCVSQVILGNDRIAR
ncbi:MAG: hypothetical protein EOP10_24105 [Proteobacteria bacterium]|nr:MAG: hypothetical protein EOP10_24105 [Pseudomonadota bacterium]